MGIIFALIAMFSWGIGDFLIQRETRKFGDWMTLFYITAFGSIVFLPFAIPHLPQLLVSNKAFFILLLAGIFELGGGIFMFEALREGKLSVEESVFTLEVFVTTLLGIAVISETPTAGQFALILILIAGIALVSLKSFHHLKNFKLEKGVLFAFGGAVGIGAADFLYGLGARETDPFLVNWFTSIFIAIIAFLYIKVFIGVSKIKQDFKKDRRFILTVSFFDNLAWLAFAFSMTFIPIAIATGISESYVALASIFGFVWGKEKLKPHQLVGLVITIIAATILAFEFI